MDQAVPFTNRFSKRYGVDSKEIKVCASVFRSAINDNHVEGLDECYWEVQGARSRREA